MARKVRGFKPHDEREYIPEAFGNRSSSDPVRVWIKSPTEKDKREVEGDGSLFRFSVDSNGEQMRDKCGNLLVEMDNEEAMRRHHRALERFVVRVENYWQPDGSAICDGEGLATHGETAIVTEIYKEIMACLSLTVDETKKSSDVPNSSLAGETQASTGIASDVEHSEKAPPEIAMEAHASSHT